MKKLFSLLLGTLVATSLTLQAAPKTGEPAPDFTLTDTAGNEHSLSDFEGKVVVLEWINHGCPFVVKFYEPGHMQKFQEEAAAKDVVWLSICSSAPGTQGHMSAEDAAKKFEEVGSKAAAYLLDEDGTVGKAYGARTTPHMYVIDSEGILVYQGGIDDKPTANKDDVEGANNYVMAALEEVLAGKPVTTSESKPYGCSVKYAK